MSATRILASLLFLAVLAGTFALSQPTDLDVLAKVARASTAHVKSSLPENARLAGPLAAFRAGDALPVEERVRVRIQTDKDMAGAEVSVTAANGQIQLKGVVQSPLQKTRAVELAERTAGVTGVSDDLAVPEK